MKVKYKMFFYGLTYFKSFASLLIEKRKYQSRLVINKTTEGSNY